MSALLDNIFWHALTGPQAAQAAGVGAARRYAAGFSPLIAFADAAAPDLGALAPFCEPGRRSIAAAGAGRCRRAGGWRQKR